MALVCALSAYVWLTFDKPITVAAHTWLGYEPMYMARGEGWLDEKQVSLLQTVSAKESIQALVDGRVDGAALTLDEMLQAREAGLPLSAVMVFNMSAGADVLVVRSGIKKLADLKGKRICMERSSVGEVMLAEILRLAKLTKHDVTLLYLPVDQHVDAWNHNQFDAAISYEPVASQMIEQNAVKIFDSREIPNTIVDVLAIRSDKLDLRHARAVRHLISAHFQALRYLLHNPIDAAYRMSAHLALPANDVLKAYKGLLLLDADNNYRLLVRSRQGLAGTAHKLSAIMVKAGMLKQDDSFKSLINADYLPVESVD